MGASAQPRTLAAPSAGGSMVKSAVAPLIGIGVALLLQFVVRDAIGPYNTKILMDIGINIILAVSLTMVNGFTGQFSVGHAGFMAIGGYTAGAITYYGGYLLWGNTNPHGAFLGWGDWLFVGGCVGGGLLAALFGYIVGLPSLRLRGDYLAIVTLGFGEIIRVTLQRSLDTLDSAAAVQEVLHKAPPRLVMHLGGALGFTGLPFYTTLFWIFAFVTATLIVAYRIKNSSHGRAFLSIREDEIAAEAMGVNTTKYKVRAFVIAAFFAGIAGGLYAHELGVTLNPRDLGFQKSFDCVIMVVLGGMGSISGGVAAAVVVTILPEMLREPPHVWPAGLLALALVLIFGGRKRVRRAISVLVAVGAWEGIRSLALARGVNLSDYRLVIYALALIVMMISRPQGIFGIREAWELGRLRRKKDSDPATAKKVTP